MPDNCLDDAPSSFTVSGYASNGERLGRHHRCEHGAGAHLLVDFWGARDLTDPARIQTALVAAAEAAKATVLHAYVHHFGGAGGVSGVVLLAESHISIHTWPERSFAALDIFMCGECDPLRALAVLRSAFKPAAVSVIDHRRGMGA